MKHHSQALSPLNYIRGTLALKCPRVSLKPDRVEVRTKMRREGRSKWSVRLSAEDRAIVDTFFETVIATEGFTGKSARSDVLMYMINFFARARAEIEELTRRIDHHPILETIQKNISLNCPSEQGLITIIQCRARRDRRDCIEKKCQDRRFLLDSL